MAAATWGQAGGTGDVDAAVDRVDPRRAGEGDDDAGGAEHRKAALDAEAAIQGLLGERCAAGDRDLDLDVGAGRMLSAISATVSVIMRRGTGLIAGSPTAS